MCAIIIVNHQYCCFIDDAVVNSIAVCFVCCVLAHTAYKHCTYYLLHTDE
jgi:hypothetical protein